MAEGKFMVAVGAIIENRATGKILLLQRANTSDFYPGIWEVPTGRMKQFEELEDALHRELAEETGIRSFEIVKPVNVSHFFRGERSAEKEIVLIIYWVRTDAEEIKISDEHDAYCWVTPEEAGSIVGNPAILQEIGTFREEKEKEEAWKRLH
jgi:8-oxo-dGTP diphosphatase